MFEIEELTCPKCEEKSTLNEIDREGSKTWALYTGLREVFTRPEAEALKFQFKCPKCGYEFGLKEVPEIRELILNKQLRDPLVDQREEVGSWEEDRKQKEGVDLDEN